MAVPRATQFIALRNLSRSTHQIRKLHMTGPATYSSPVLTTDRPTSESHHDMGKDHSKRPTISQPEQPSQLTTRHFNTTRSLKAVGDSSTIDFAYLPSGDVDPAAEEVFRVPILPNNYTYRTTPETLEPEAAVMKPEISAMSADAVILPMADLSDGHAMNVDFHAMADRVAANLKRMQVPVEEQAGMMKQLWNDLVDDMLSIGKKAS